MLPSYTFIENQSVVDVSVSMPNPFIIRGEIPITQSGSGTPTRTNARPFVGYYKSTVTVSPNQSGTGATTHEVQFWDTPKQRPGGYIDEGDYVYGAYFDVDRNGNGTLTQLYRFFILNNHGTFKSFDSANGIFYVENSIYNKYLKTITEDEVPPIYCTRFTAVKYSELAQHDDCITYAPGDKSKLYIKCSYYANKLSQFRTFISQNSIRIVAERDTPYVTTFNATTISPLQGQNYVWQNLGNILRLGYMSYESGSNWDCVKNGNFQHIRITFLLDNVVFEDADLNASNGCTITTYMNPDIDLTFGIAYMSEISLSLFRSQKTDQLNWVREFKVELGVEYDGEIMWTQLGIFSGQRPKSITDYTISFNAYDRMQRFDRSVEDFMSLMTYPCSLQDVYDGLCTFVGIPNEQGDEISSVMSRTFTSAFSTDGISTCRELLSRIAEANGCYAKLTNEGKVKLVWFDDRTSDYSLMRDVIFGIESTDLTQISGYRWNDLAASTWATVSNIKWSEMFHRDNVQIYEGVRGVWDNTNEDYTQPPTLDSGARVYTINGNPFMHYSTEQAIRDHLQLLLTRLSAFEIYYVANTVAVGNWLVEPGDIINHEMEDGSFEPYPIFSRTLTWNGYCECEYESTGNLVK